MKNYRKESILIGLFFLIAMAGSLIGAGMIEPVVTSADPISAAVANQSALLAGVFLELTCAVCVVGIAMFMSPILKTANPSLSAGYLGFRVVEAVFCTMITIAPATLIALSKMPLSNANTQAAQVVILIRSFSAGLPLAIFFLPGRLLPVFRAAPWKTIAEIYRGMGVDLGDTGIGFEHRYPILSIGDDRQHASGNANDSQ